MTRETGATLFQKEDNTVNLRFGFIILTKVYYILFIF